MTENILKTKSYEFSIKIVKLYQHLSQEKQEFILSKQLIRSWTSIWALVREAEFGQSRADFINKMSIALKESIETKYRLRLLREGWYLWHFPQENEIIDKANEMVGVLTKIVKTTKYNLSI